MGCEWEKLGDGVKTVVLLRIGEIRGPFWILGEIGEEVGQVGEVSVRVVGPCRAFGVQIYKLGYG